MKKEYAKYLLEKTRKDYNRIAEDYARLRGKMWPEAGFLFEKFITKGEKILDLGCGTGRYSESIRAKGGDYVGVDISPRMIEAAKERCPRAKFQVADSLNLPFSDESFDKIYSIAVLHQIPSEELRVKFLKEARRVLKQDGLLILTVWKFRTKKELSLIFKYTILRLIGKSKLDWRDFFEPWGKKIERYYHCFSKKELVNLVKKADFQVLKSGFIRNERGNRNNIYLIAKKSR